MSHATAMTEQSPLITVHVQAAAEQILAPGAVRHRCCLPGYGLLYVTRGELTVTINRQHFTLQVGWTMLLPDGACADMSSTEGAQWYEVGMEASMLYSVEVLQLFQPPLCWNPDDCDPDAQMSRTLGIFLQQLVREVTVADAATSLMSSGLAQAIFAICWRSAYSSSAVIDRQTMFPHWIPAVFEAVIHSRELTVADMARVSGYSTTQFRRLFGATLNISPHAFLQRTRLDFAKRLLETTDLPINIIAEQVGFSSVSHFSRLYKRMRGIPPSAVRQAARDRAGEHHEEA